MGSLKMSEHALSFNENDTEGQKLLVEVMSIPAQKQIAVDINEVEIVFFAGGQTRIIDGKGGKTVDNGQIMLFPIGSKFVVTPLDDVTVTILRLKKDMQFHYNFTIEKICMGVLSTDAGHMALDINGTIKAYLDNFIECVNSGLCDRSYVDLKIKELLFLLKTFYSSEELTGFFAPLISSDIEFSNFMFKNYRKVKNTTDLRQMTNMSMSALKKKFKKVFGMPAGQWLNLQKEKDVMHDLVYSDKNLKEIAHEYFFSSTAHLSKFCKQRFHMTPGAIRARYTGKKHT